MTALALLALWRWRAAIYQPDDIGAVRYLWVEQWRDLPTPEAVALLRLLNGADRPKGAPWLH